MTLPEGSFLVGLSSVHWREAWKYGERATSVSRARLARLNLRGRQKVNAQWHPYCMVHNIEKLANSGCRQ